MLPQYNVEELIENIKRRCSVPSSQLTYTPEDFTLLANDELQGEVVPLIMSTREEYFVDHYDVVCPADGIIEFPDNTVGIKIRNISYLQQTVPQIMISLPRIDLDVVTGVGYSNYATISGFYIEGNKIVLYPTQSVPANTTMRIYYYRRTLVLAAPEQYGQVQSIDALTNTLVLDFVPTSWGIGTVLNSVSSTSGFGITNEEITITAVSSPSIIVDDVTDIVVGDYLSLQGFSAVPQIPIEAHAYLAQLTAAKCLEGLGDNNGMQAALAKAVSLKQSLLVMISQRVDGSVKKVVNPTGGLRLNAGLGRWGRGSTGGGTW